MKALILAGGLGTRLRPLTYSRPKHLLPIANRPHIARVFDLLFAHGIDDVVLLTSYLAAEFRSVVDEARSSGIGVEVTHEDEPLGTAGALKNAEVFVGDSTFVVFNGDILTGADITGLVEFHRANDSRATMLLTPVEDPSAFGVVPTDAGGRVTAFIEKPEPGTAPTNLINAGVYVMEPSVLDAIPAGEVWSAERQLFPQMVEDDVPFFARSSDAYWMDVGTPEKYLQANMDVLSREFETADVAAGGIVAAAGAEVAVSARVSSVCLGAGATIAEDSEVVRTVLLPGASIGRGARVTDSILGANARIGDGAVVDGAVIADDDVVA
jgi:mannose-1-phosphate guanylyltransferase